MPNNYVHASHLEQSTVARVCSRDGRGVLQVLIQNTAMIIFIWLYKFLLSFAAPDFTLKMPIARYWMSVRIKKWNQRYSVYCCALFIVFVSKILTIVRVIYCSTADPRNVPSRTSAAARWCRPVCRLILSNSIRTRLNKGQLLVHVLTTLRIYRFSLSYFYK